MRGVEMLVAAAGEREFGVTFQGAVFPRWHFWCVLWRDTLIIIIYGIVAFVVFSYTFNKQKPRIPPKTIQLYIGREKLHSTLSLSFCSGSFSVSLYRCLRRTLLHSSCGCCFYSIWMWTLLHSDMPFLFLYSFLWVLLFRAITFSVSMSRVKWLWN